MDIENQVIGALAGLVIGTLLGNEISRFLYRPRVIIRFKEISPLYSKDGFFWSIVVANHGRTAASNCIGTITIKDLPKENILGPADAMVDEALPKYEDEDIDLDYPRSPLITPDKFRDIKNCTLCWSQLGNEPRIDINPGTTQTLDVCRVQFNTQKQFWYLVLPSERGWRKVRLRMKVTNIKGRILICPSNEFPTVLDFEIKQKKNEEPIFIAIQYSFLKRVFRQFRRQKLYFD